MEKQVPLFFYAPKVVGKILPNQGWKIHISTNYQNYTKIIEEVEVYCLKMKVDYKYIREESLDLVLSKRAELLSAGKVITIYPSSEDEFIASLKGLYQILKNEVGPKVLTDQQYKDCKVIHYRFGAISSTDGKIANHNGERIEDLCYPYYNLPEFVSDTFIKNDLILKKSYLFENYIVEKCLRSSAGGGVYEGKTSDTQKEVIIKEYRSEIYLVKDISMIAVGQREIEWLKKLNQLNIPQLIAFFYEENNLYVVTEKIKGITLREFKEKSSPLQIPRWDLEKIREVSFKMNRCVFAMIHLVERLHGEGIIHHDISLDNFMITEDDKVYMLDFECSYDIHQGKIVDVKKNNIQQATLNHEEQHESVVSLELKEVAWMLMDMLASTGRLAELNVPESLIQKYFYRFICQYQLEDSYLLLSSILDWKKDNNQEEPLLPQLISEIQRIETYFVCDRHDKLEGQKFLSSMAKLVELKEEIQLKGLDLEMLDTIDNMVDKIDCYAQNQIKIEMEQLLTSILEINLQTELKLLVNEEGYYTPYINGTSGLLKIVMKWLDKFPSNKLEQLCQETLLYIDFDFSVYPGYKIGLTGIMDVFLDAFERFKDEKYLESAKEKFMTISLFKTNNTFHNIYFNLIEANEYLDLQNMLVVFKRLANLLKMDQIEKDQRQKWKMLKGKKTDEKLLLIE